MIIQTLEFGKFLVTRVAAKWFFIAVDQTWPATKLENVLAHIAQQFLYWYAKENSHQIGIRNCPSQYCSAISKLVS